MIGFPLFYAAIVLIVTLFTGNLLGALTASAIVFVGSFFAMAIPDKHLATDTQAAQRSTFLKMIIMSVILVLTSYYVNGPFVLFMLAFYVTLVRRTNKLNWRVIFGKGE